MKKIMYLLTVSMLLLNCAACGKDESKSKPKVNGDNATVDENEDIPLIFDEMTPYNGKCVKIACVGDSLTFGYTTEDPATMSYPYQLEEMMQGKVEVVNCGKSGAYVLPADNVYNVKKDQPEKSYRNTEEYKKSIECCPDVVIIMMGTNDVRSIYANSEAQQEYVNQLGMLIEQYQALSSVKKIYVASSINSHVSTEFINLMTDGPLGLLQKSAAEQWGVDFIDIQSITHDDFQNLSYYNADHLHLTQQGYRKIAEAFFNQFKK